jgi:hypothetical protein
MEAYSAEPERLTQVYTGPSVMVCSTAIVLSVESQRRAVNSLSGMSLQMEKTTYFTV